MSVYADIMSECGSLVDKWGCMIRKCICYIEYKDGGHVLKECSLNHNLPFTLKEMEEWTKKKDHNVKKVVCFERDKRDG